MQRVYGKGGIVVVLVVLLWSGRARKMSLSEEG